VAAQVATVHLFCLTSLEFAQVLLP
jgi:hypothetical protein